MILFKPILLPKNSNPGRQHQQSLQLHNKAQQQSRTAASGVHVHAKRRSLPVHRGANHTWGECRQNAQNVRNTNNNNNDGGPNRRSNRQRRNNAADENAAETNNYKGRDANIIEDPSRAGTDEAGNEPIIVDLNTAEVADVHIPDAEPYIPVPFVATSATSLFCPLRNYKPCVDSLDRWDKDHLNLGNWRSARYWYLKLGNLENIPKSNYLESTTAWQRALELFHQDDKGGTDDGRNTDSLAVEQFEQPDQLQATAATITLRQIEENTSVPEDNEAAEAFELDENNDQKPAAKPANNTSGA